MFATAICKLEDVEVDYNNLSIDQMSALFTKMAIYKHCLKSLIISYDKRLKSLNESVVTEALMTLRSIEFHDLPQRFFNHFIANVKVSPGVKTRYVTTTWESRRKHQRMLEDALAENVHVNFIPIRTVLEETECDTEEDQPDEDYEDYDRVEEMEKDLLSEEDINDFNNYCMMMRLSRMINDLGASDSNN